MIDRDLFESKVGYDWANKKMMVRVYDSLYSLLEQAPDDYNKSWVNVIRLMLISEGVDLSKTDIRVNGYYNAIKRNLKQIGVIQYNGRELVTGPNWDRFYSDENWDWFKTDTSSGGWAEIIK